MKRLIVGIMGVMLLATAGKAQSCEEMLWGKITCEQDSGAPPKWENAGCCPTLDQMSQTFLLQSYRMAGTGPCDSSCNSQQDWWFGPEPPEGLSFLDEGTVVYTNPIDPKQDSVRNMAMVDPASGSLSFRLPLKHTFRGRSADVELALSFNSGKNQPGGLFGHFWSGSWDRKLVVDYLDKLGPLNCQNSPRTTEFTGWVNALPRITERNGGSSTVWTNRDLIERVHGFSDEDYETAAGLAYEVVGLPSGNLAGCGQIIPPSDSQAGYLAAFSNGDPPGTGGGDDAMMFRADTLVPFWLGDTDASALRAGITEFVPPLGDFRKIDFSCAGTFIRQPDGTLDVYHPFSIVGEHRVQLPEYLQPPENTFRAQAIARLWRTYTANGDFIEYQYDGDNGRCVGIRDNFGRVVVTFNYAPDLTQGRLESIVDLEGRTTEFQYGDQEILEAIAMPGADRVWRFEYDKHVLTVPVGSEFRETLVQNGVTILDQVRIYSPEDALNEPSVRATLSNAASQSGMWIENPCVSQMLLGGGYARDFDTDGDGVVDHSFGSVAQNVTYTYSFPEVCDDSSQIVTTATDVGTGHVTTYRFDWQSRELDRTEDVAFNGTVDQRITTYAYSGYHPKATQTILPLGNTTIQTFQFELDDAAGLSYFRGGRDRFQGGNLRSTRTISSDPNDAEIVESYVYEPLNNQVWTHVDPTGQQTQYDFDFQEGAWTEIEVFAGIWGIDWTNGPPVGLGDLNADGVTDQLSGRAIRTHLPEITSGLATSLGQAVLVRQHNEVGQVLVDIDAEGRVVTSDYHPADDPNGDGLHLGGDPNLVGAGYLKSSTVDPNGLDETVLFGTTERGEELWATDPLGHLTWREFDDWGQVKRELSGEVSTSGQPIGANPVYSEIQFQYDRNGNLIEQSELIGDGVTNASSQLNPGWKTSRFGYDNLDQVRAYAQELYDPVDGSPARWTTTYFHYGSDGTVAKEVSAEGRAISYERDSLGRVRRKRQHLTLDPNPHQAAIPATDPSDPLLKFNYDDNGNLIKARVMGDSGQSYLYQMTYDGFDRRVKLRNPLNHATEHTYDAAGNVVNVKNVGPRDPNDTGSATLREVDYLYDERHRLWKTKSRFFQWELDNGIWKIEFDGGREMGYAVQEYGFDQDGLLVEEVDDQSRATTTVYDAALRETHRYQPLIDGRTQRNYSHKSYDTRGLLVTETVHSWSEVPGSGEQEELFVTTWDYDALGRKIQQVDQPGAESPPGVSIERVQHWTFDALGRELTHLNPEGVGTKTWRDTLGRDQRVAFGFDDQFDESQIGQIVNTHNPDGYITVERDFDDDGLRVAQRDDASNETAWQHDAVGRQALKIHADGSKQSYAHLREGKIDLEERFFDNAGVDQLFSSIDYTYDAALRKTQAVFTPGPGINLSGVYEEQFEYDGLDRVIEGVARSAMPFTGDDVTANVVKRYDSMDLLRSDAQSFDLVPTSGSATAWSDEVRCEYDGLGRRTEVTATGYSRSYFHDALGRVTEVRGDGGLVLHEMDWLGGGARLQEQRNLNGSKVVVGLGGWDLHGQIGQLDHVASNGSTIAAYEYSYDRVGNLLQDTRPLEAGNSKRFAYDKGNRLVGFDVGDDTAGWTTADAWELDGSGNWKEHNGHTNQVDEVHRYQGLFDGQAVGHDEWGNLLTYGTKGYVYDARGRVVGVLDGGQMYEYAYDPSGRRVLAEGHAVTHEGIKEIRRESLSSPSDVETYTYGASIERVLSMSQGTQDYTLHHNRLGSTIAVTNSVGQEVESYDYDAYGIPTVTDVDGGGTLDIPYLFAGYRQDASGLYHARARSYLPDMGRFTSRDPIGLWGDANNWGNPYTYVGASPRGGIDPLGLWGFSKAFGAIKSSVSSAASSAASAVGSAASAASSAASSAVTSAVSTVVEALPPPAEIREGVRNYAAGVVDGAVSGLSAGLADGWNPGADLLGADTSSLAYAVGDVVGDVAGGVALGAATGGSSAVVAGSVKAVHLAGTANDLIQTASAVTEVAASVQAGGFDGMSLGDAAEAAARVAAAAAGKGGKNGGRGGAGAKKGEEARSNPNRGEPGSISRVNGRDGEPKQNRRYGDDGYPETDVDFDHDHGQGQPHAHDWAPSEDGGFPDRGPGREIEPGDPIH